MESICTWIKDRCQELGYIMTDEKAKNLSDHENILYLKQHWNKIGVLKKLLSYLDDKINQVAADA